MLGAFIRNVTHTRSRAESIASLAREVEMDGAKLYLADDSQDVARHAVAHGWIQEEALEVVAAAVGNEGKQPDRLDELIDAPARSAGGPTLL